MFKTFVENAASENVIILVHGWMHSSARWQSLIEELKDDYCVISVDLPGFGESQNFDADKVTLDTVADMFCEKILELTETKEIRGVIAHSMGGMVVLKSTLQLGDFSESYFLCDIPVRKSFFLALANRFRWLMRISHRITKELPLSIGRPLIKISALPTVRKYGQIDEIIVTDALKADSEISMNLISEIFHASILDLEIPQLSRCVVCRGVHDLLVSKATAVELANKIGGQLLEFPDASHTPQLEVESLFNSTVKKHLLHNSGEKLMH